MVNIFRQQFQLQEKYDFTVETKTNAILERDEVQPNKSLVCNLGSVLTTKKTIGMAMKKHNLIALVYKKKLWVNKV